MAATDVLGAEPGYFGDAPWMDSALLASAEYMRPDSVVQLAGT